MAVIDGVGVKLIKLLDSEPNTKNFIRIKETESELAQDVIYVDGSSKNFINAVKVTHDHPKNYLLVRDVRALMKSSYVMDSIDDYFTTDITLQPGDSVSVTFEDADFSTSRPFFRSTPTTIIVDGGGNLYHANNGVDFDVEVNGVVEGNWHPIPNDGREITLTIIAKTQISIDAFGIMGTGERFFSGKVKKFATNIGGVVNDFSTKEALSNGFVAHNFNDENWV